MSVVAEERDEAARTQTSVLRYERYRGEQSTVEERPWQLHWHTRADFEELASAAGLATVSVTGADGGPATREATDLQFRLRVA